MEKISVLDQYRKTLIADSIDDTHVNLLWDKFMEAAEIANTWRDHESLDIIIQIIYDLRPSIEISESLDTVEK